MRDQIFEAIRQIAESGADSSDRTTIFVAAIGAAAAVIAAAIAAFARRPDDNGTADLLKQIDEKNDEIDRLQALLWSNQINPATGDRIVPK